MKVLKAPRDYDWDGLMSTLLEAADLSLPVEPEVKLSGSFRAEAHVTGEATIKIINAPTHACGLRLSLPALGRGLGGGKRILGLPAYFLASARTVFPAGKQSI
jgi:hypothetical protein